MYLSVFPGIHMGKIIFLLPYGGSWEDKRLLFYALF